ncbi:MAG: M48 family metalloprotease [Candidatus Hodarchaeales archaeon]
MILSISQIELSNLMDIFSNYRILSGLLCLLLTLIFLLELRKYLKYQSFPDVMELSGIGSLSFGLYSLTGDILLAVLAGILALMIIGTFEIRENPIWLRMMFTFTISYGFFFTMVLIGYITTHVFPSLGAHIASFLSQFLGPEINVQQFFIGIGYNLIIWIMVITAFIVFGRKFIIVTRFISPQMTYLVLYFIALLIILQLNLPKVTISLPTGTLMLEIWKYLAIFAANVFIYLISGYLLTFLFGIKPLQSERVEKIIKEVQVKIDTPIRKIGIVKAPILNAFAFGPWFDQRIAYIASDLEVFTDSEIRGITAHELAHVQHKHTLLLLVITALELAFKALIDAPSSPWEYVLQLNNPAWDFLTFWVFNIILFAFLLTFVKMLEGQADKVTREAGFGLDLAESLYRLESFYYGIAGEIGFNTQLMTGKQRSKEENIRFMGDQAFYLYRNLAPSRMTCFMNLIASHPLTSIRIALQIDKSMGAFNTGLMVWMLLIPGLRKRTIRKLQKNHQEFAHILSHKFTDDFGSISSYIDLTYEEQEYKRYLGRHLLAKPWLLDSSAHWGEVIELKRTENIISPITMVLKLKDGSKIELAKCDYELILADAGDDYFNKKGEIVTLKDIYFKKGKVKNFIFDKNGSEVKSKSLGLRIKDLKFQDYWLAYQKGYIQPWEFKKFTLSSDFRSSIFIFQNEDGEEISYLGKDIVVASPPLIQFFKTKNWDKEKKLFEKLMRLGEPFILYDKEDIDIGAPVKVKSITENSMQILEGNQVKTLPSKQIDAIVLDYPFFLVNFKNEMGLGNLISLKIFNRGNKTKYIGL